MKDEKFLQLTKCVRRDVKFMQINGKIRLMYVRHITEDKRVVYIFRVW